MQVSLDLGCILLVLILYLFNIIYYEIIDAGYFSMCEYLTICKSCSMTRADELVILEELGEIVRDVFGKTTLCFGFIRFF